MWLKEQFQNILEYVCGVSLKWITRESTLVDMIQSASGRLYLIRKQK